MSRFAIFDLDDTLVDTRGGIDRWFVELSEKRALGPEGLAFLRYEQQRPVSPQESFRAIVEHFGFDDSPDDLRRAFGEQWPLLVRPFPDAVAGLRSLRSAGWRTALLTNGRAWQQRPKLRDGLDELFDAVCFADDEAVRKPDPAAFDLVAGRAGADPAGGWMVGDSLEFDIVGGCTAGLSTVWVSGGRPLPDGAPAPDVVVATVVDAYPLLLRAEERGSTPPRPR